MKSSSCYFPRKIGRAAVLAMIAALATFWLGYGKRNPPNPFSDAPVAAKARLISIQSLPDVGGEMCEWVPASAGRSLSRTWWQERLAARVEAGTEEAQRAQVAQRKPLRMIRDSYALYSAVAVDTARQEVVLQDENLFRTLVYDRRADTPPSATMTEPKRIIAGLETELEFNCALYIDPKSGDIYSVNNDTVDKLVIFSRQAKGNVPPDRKLHTPHGAFGIAVDEAAQEMFLTIQHSNAMVVFPKMAKDETPPIRLLQGDRTLLADPHGIALDTKNNLIFVSNFGSTLGVRPDGASEAYFGGGRDKQYWPLDPGHAVPGSGRNLPASITVFPKNASGDIAPLRVIQGPKTQLNWPAGMAVDSERGELYVANDMGDSVLVFSTLAGGDVAPTRALKGPRTLIKYPSSVALDLENDELWVANFGNHAATVYRRTANGDTPPLRVIRSAPLASTTPTLANPHPVAFDTKREQILVPN